LRMMQIMKGFFGQYYIYDMAHQMYNMNYKMIWCVLLKTEGNQYNVRQIDSNQCNLIQIDSN
jgi:hypothetical protein